MQAGYAWEAVKIIRQNHSNGKIFSNIKRLHNSLGYVTPENKLQGDEKRIFGKRDCKLAEAREIRKQKRHQSRRAIKEQARESSKTELAETAQQI
jgi:hypothetical protein